MWIATQTGFRPISDSVLRWLASLGGGRCLHPPLEGNGPGRQPNEQRSRMAFGDFLLTPLVEACWERSHSQTSLMALDQSGQHPQPPHVLSKPGSLA
jgi:hypothetical protein